MGEGIVFYSTTTGFQPQTNNAPPPHWGVVRTKEQGSRFRGSDSNEAKRDS